MSSLQAITTAYGLEALSGALKETVTQYQLIGALTPSAESDTLYDFYSGEIETSYFDEEGVLSFVLNLPIDTHFDEYLHQIYIMDADGQNVITCETPKVALAKGVGGMMTLKSDITGVAGEVVFKHSEYITEPELFEVHSATDEEIDGESTNEKVIKLSQLWRALQPSRLVDKLWLGLAAKIFPVGAFIPWFTDEAPEGFAIGKGQAYDKATFTELAKVFPDGVIPDMRGCGVIGKEDGETIGAYEEGQVKQHGHPGSSASSTNLGTKTSASKSTPYLSNVQTTLSDGNRDNMGIPTSGWSGYQVKGGASGTAWATRYYNKLLSHNHTLVIGSHTHSVAVALFGALKNTINHRKVNWIVRMA